MIADSIDNDTEPETRNATPASDSAAAAGTGPGTPGTENQGLRPFKFKLSAQAWPAADSESARRVGATLTAPDGPEASAGESLPGRGRVNGGDIKWARPGRHSPFMMPLPADFLAFLIEEGVPELFPFEWKKG
jgi:hypothetical protein